MPESFVGIRPSRIRAVSLVRLSKSRWQLRAPLRRLRVAAKGLFQRFATGDEFADLLRDVRTTSKVEVYQNNDVVAVHDRYYGKGYKYVTLQDHLATQHKYLSEWNPQKFMATATAISEVVAQYIAKILAREMYPEQSYKSCSGVLSFAKRVGNTRLTNACKRADSYGVYNYGIIDQILRSKADQIPVGDEIINPYMPSHDNIRGQHYYE